MATNRESNQGNGSISFETNMPHAWAGDLGLLAEIQGTVEYLVGIGETYIVPTSSPQNLTGVLMGNLS